MVSVGYRAESYASGTEFLDALPAHQPDCVVLDVHMPVVNGFEVQARLKDRGSDVPVVIITGHDTPESQQRALNSGAIAYLRKPVNDQVLIDAINTAISKKSARRP